MEKRVIRSIGRLMLAMAMTFVLPVSVSAQDYENTPVSISKEKIRVDGKVCYSHIVLERQTLFSISKAYNVSIEDIYRYNPSVKENGLKKNSILIIPCNDEPAVHVAEPEKTEAPAVQTQSDGTVHIVKWYEDLDVIAEKYGVTVEAIMKANGLKGRKLTKRQKLIIPASSDIVVEETVTEEIPSTEEVDTPAEETEEAVQEEDTEDRWIFPDREVSVSLLLPLKATGSASSRNNMDFYSGVLLAARELTDKGTDLHLNVYDIAEGVAGIPSDVLKTSDFIIGPIAPNDISGIAAIVQGSCPIVSPLDQRVEKLTGQHGNLIHAPSPQRAQFTDIACWLKEEMQYGDRIIVISEKGARQNDGGRQLKAVIEQHSISYTPFSYSILEGRDIQSSLEAAMTSSGVNRVVIASESEAFVNDAVRNLNLILHNKFNVVLYAPAKIRTFETIEVENFHNTSLHASLTYNIDYDNKDVQDFIMKYRAMFGTEPTQFAFQGYDLTKYFVGIASRYQTGWMSHLTEEEAEMLQNTFRFNKNGDGGYTNSGIRRVIYDKGYSIVTVE